MVTKVEWFIRTVGSTVDVPLRRNCDRAFGVGNFPAISLRAALETGRRRAHVFEVTVDQFAAFVRETGYDAGSNCWTLENGKVDGRTNRSWRNPGYAQDG